MEQSEKCFRIQISTALMYHFLEKLSQLCRYFYVVMNCTAHFNDYPRRPTQSSHFCSVIANFKAHLVSVCYHHGRMYLRYSGS